MIEQLKGKLNGKDCVCAKGKREKKNKKKGTDEFSLKPLSTSMVICLSRGHRMKTTRGEASVCRRGPGVCVRLSVCVYISICV